MTDLHLTLDRTAGRFAAQVAAELRSGIRAGRLPAGARLPSSRDLARDLGVSRGVVVEAYEQLAAEGFLVSRQGAGTRIAPHTTTPAPPPAPAIPTPPNSAPVVWDLWPGVPDLRAFPRGAWAAAVRQAVWEVPGEELGYPDPAGVAALRRELAGYLGRVRAAAVEPGRLVVTHGVAQALYGLVRELAVYGPLAVEEPTSTRQLPLLREAGADLVPVPVDDEGIDVAALGRTGARAVVVTPAHQYPTGVVLSARRRTALLAWARRIGGVVLEDDYDAEFRYDREPVGCVQGLDPERVVLLGSVSKSMAPALRLGWAVAPEWLAVRLTRFRAITDLGSPVIEQYALARMISSGAYDRHLRAMRRAYRERRDALVAALGEHLPGAVVRGVSAGLHVYVELPSGCPAEAARAAAGVAGVRCAAAVRGLVLGYARLSPARLAEAAAVLGRVVTAGAGG
jgi:DNA-binding transcriptional MocR family regulator